MQSVIVTDETVETDHAIARRCAGQCLRGITKLGISVAHAIRFTFEGLEQVPTTITAIFRKQRDYAFSYLYSRFAKKKGCFHASFFWARLPYLGRAECYMTHALNKCLNTGTTPSRSALSKKVAPKNGTIPGNLPRASATSPLTRPLLS